MVERNEDRLDRLEANLSKINADAKYILDLLEKRNARLEEMNNRFDYGNRLAADTSIQQGNWYRGPDPGGGVNIVRQRNQNMEPNPIGGTRTGNHLDYSAVTRMVELDCPRFDGREVSDWLFKVDRFFEMDVTPEFHKIRLVSNHLDGEAATWHQSFMLSEVGRRINKDWDHYKVKVRERFADPIAELKRLHETDGIEAYHAKFERIIFRWDLSEEYLVNAYIAGLKLDMQIHVRMFKPDSIKHCYFLGRLYERFPPKKNVSCVNIRSNSNDGQWCNQKGILPSKKVAEPFNSIQVEEERVLKEDLIQDEKISEADEEESIPQFQVPVSNLESDNASMVVCKDFQSVVGCDDSCNHQCGKLQVSRVESMEAVFKNRTYDDKSRLEQGFYSIDVVKEMVFWIVEFNFCILITEKGRKLQQHEKIILSLFSKNWMFKFKKQGFSKR